MDGIFEYAPAYSNFYLKFSGKGALQLKLPQLDGIPYYGICPFSQVEPFLLSCRGRQRIPKEAASVIVCLFPYYTPQKGNISRYAAVPDYHHVVMPILKQAAGVLQKQYPHHQFEAFVDHSPIPEVAAACLAGLGVRGDNGLLLTTTHGSYVFIGEIVTDLDLHAPNGTVKECVHCGACKAVCPTGCIESNDKPSQCLSALTQKKGELSEQEKRLIVENGSLWGCDRCQEVCPYNRQIPTTEIAAFLADVRPDFTEGDDIEGRAFAWRGRSVIERNAHLKAKNQSGGKSCNPNGDVIK